ncbi:single-stranded-DNA-specific exonuclease RecJ [Microaerobacter geothermalis]|uniref:single-stranded-DNA-specific exonuclease RecJ n=1 Tax=Microaerobacter geothermalis TaxID=674972 RepID=UPI001F37ECBF|nr:single-stranded-DNA-specific exonuclease RecJ [Microaerobacter geothermalis]MCF6092763.1 single-stranded-DNA-specific exonuclease RecJ [Microaerobacter geothermalis]
MLHAKTRWKLCEIDPEKAELIQKKFGISPILSKLLVSRGIDNERKVREFLQADESTIPDPFLMHDMAKAVGRIRIAIERKEKILIYGDYDADGVSSTSLLIHTLSSLEANFDYYIPNRFSEGYGLNQDAIHQAIEKGFSLLITVDTGISALDETAYAQSKGIDVIITDHHEPPSVLPEAYAIVHPKLSGSSYPFPHLAGVGVAFKLAHALLERIPYEWLDIVALGTIADLVPLIGENRTIVKLGLQVLNQTPNIGLKALCQVSGLQGKEIGTGQVGFALAPRINAGGRLETAYLAVQLLTADQMDEAVYLAAELDRLNRERQSLVEEIYLEAEQKVLSHPDLYKYAIVVAKKDWNIGVIGIVASRLVERFYKPVIVLSMDEEKGVAKGSARSIEGFDLYQSLSAMEDILPHFGGHKMAAGMTLSIDHIDDLRKRFNFSAKEILSGEDYVPITQVDIQCELSDIELKLAEELESLAPYGMGNPVPLIMLKGVYLSQIRKIGRDGTHLKCTILKNHKNLDGVGFQMGELSSQISQESPADIIGQISINEWNGYRRPQMVLKDMVVRERQIFDWRGCPRSERLLSIPNIAHSTIICFQYKSQRELEVIIEQGNRVDDLLYFDGSFNGQSGWNMDSSCKQVICYDLPLRIDDLSYVLSFFPNAERIYCLFGDKDLPKVEALPARDHFKWVYQRIRTLRNTSLKQMYLYGIKNQLSSSMIQFMIDVFHELGFIHLDMGKIAYIDQPKKRELSESALYQKRMDEIRLETELIFSTTEELKKTIDSMINQRNTEEEKVYGLQGKDSRDSRFPTTRYSF